MQDFQPLNERELAAVDKVREIFQGMNLIPCTACRYCVAGCPAHISIPDLFAAMNTKQIYHDWNADYYYQRRTHRAGQARRPTASSAASARRPAPSTCPSASCLMDVAEEFEKKPEA